jgi:RNA polymerase sigma factor (sigma-70 family)
MVQGGVKPDGRTDAELVQAARSTEPEAFGQLFDRWFDRSWNVARNIVRQDDIAAEVAQDAMLNAWQRLDQLRDVEAFGGWLLRITRNRALNRLERERRSRATGDEIVSGLRDRRLHEGQTDPTGAQTPPSTDAVVDIRDRQELVWAAAAALGERDASLLDLHLRHGLAPAEIAEELGVEANTAHQQLFRMRNKLGDAIGSYVLWRNGRPLCDGLAAAVSGQVAFDRSVSKAVAKHQKSCDQCSERRAALLDPSKLFASVPLVGVPLQLKVDAAAALHNAGVPVDPASISAGGRSLDPPDGPEGPPTEPPQADGWSSMSEPPSSTPQTAGQSVLADTAVGYDNGSIGAGDPTGSSSTASSGLGPSTSPSTSLPSTALPSKALLGKMAIVGSATVLVGLILLAVWQAGLFGLMGGDEVAADGSEIVAGPTISSDTDELDPGSAGQAESTTGQAPLGGNESADGSADDGTSDDDGAVGGTTGGSEDGSDVGGSDESGSGSDPTAGTTPTTRTDGPTTTVDDGPTTGPTTATTGTTRRTTTTSTTVSTTVTTATRPQPTDSTATTDPGSSITTTSTRETTTNPPPDPPVILRFTSRASANQLRCNDRTQRAYDAIWATENTSSVQLSLPDGTGRTGKPSGSASFCGAPGDTIILVASGPGGSDKAGTTLN